MRNSKDWKLDCQYLNKTIQSILHQTNDKYHIFVVFHDMPSVECVSCKIEYLHFPYPYCEFENIEDRHAALRDSGYLTPKDIEFLFDQGRKQMFGALHAKQRGFEYIMSVDADDLVSKNLVDFVSVNKTMKMPGWYVNKGYYYIVKHNVFIRQPYSMNIVCGSTNCVHRDFIPSVDFEQFRLGIHNYFANHAYLTTLIKKEYGQELKPFPFYAIVYTVTELNWWISIAKLKGDSLYFRLKYMIRKVLFPSAITRKFYIADKSLL